MPPCTFSSLSNREYSNCLNVGRNKIKYIFSIPSFFLPLNSAVGMHSPTKCKVPGSIPGST